MPLKEWIRQEYQRGLLKIISTGALIAFFLCIGVGYSIESENNATIAGAFTSSIRNWVYAGDLLQLKQVIGQLIDSGTIDFVVVKDADENVIVSNGLVENQWRGNTSTFYFSKGSALRVSCLPYEVSVEKAGVFCFGKKLIAGWFLALGGLFALFFLVIFVLISQYFNNLSNILVQHLIFISAHAKQTHDESSESIEIKEVKETVDEIKAFVDREKKRATA